MLINLRELVLSCSTLSGELIYDFDTNELLLDLPNEDEFLILDCETIDKLMSNK